MQLTLLCSPYVECRSIRDICTMPKHRWDQAGAWEDHVQARHQREPQSFLLQSKGGACWMHPPWGVHQEWDKEQRACFCLALFWYFPCQWQQWKQYTTEGESRSHKNWSPVSPIWWICVSEWKQKLVPSKLSITPEVPPQFSDNVPFHH